MAGLLYDIAEYDPRYEYGTLLPFRKNKNTKIVEFSTPGLIKDIARAVTAPERAYLGLIDVDSPEAVMEASNIAGLLGEWAVASIGTSPMTKGQVAMLKTPVGRIPENGTDTRKLADMLKRAGEAKGYRVEHSGSAISPSQYVTYSKTHPETGEILNEMQVRLSNHADKYPELANGVRTSVDPDTQVSFEQAVNWLAKRGYPTSLSTRYKDVPTWAQYYERQSAIKSEQNKQMFNAIAKNAEKLKINDFSSIEKKKSNLGAVYVGDMYLPDGSPSRHRVYARELIHAGLEPNKENAAKALMNGRVVGVKDGSNSIPKELWEILKK